MPFAMSLPIPLLRTEDNMVRNSAFLAALLVLMPSAVPAPEATIAPTAA